MKGLNVQVQPPEIEADARFACPNCRAELAVTYAPYTVARELLAQLKQLLADMDWEAQQFHLTENWYNHDRQKAWDVVKEAERKA